MTVFWRKVIVTLGYFAAGMIILAAFMVSITNLVTPILNEHRGDFEKFASRILERPVQIAKVSISWNLYEPEVALQDVTLLDPSTQRAVLKIPLIKINLDLLRSLFHLKPVLESLKVVGCHLTFYQQAPGEINLEGFSQFAMTDKLTGSALNTNAVFAWIFSQPNLILQDIHIRFVPYAGKEKIANLRRLILHNSANQHKLTGKVTLLQQIPTKLSIDFNWQGSAADFSHVSAHLYLYFEGIALPQWLDQQTWHDLRILQGLGSAKIWAVWNHNAWQKIQTTLQFYDIEVESKTLKKPILISRISGNLGWKRQASSQVIAGDNLLIDLPDHLWPNTNFTAEFTKMPDGMLNLQQLQIGYLDLADTAKIMLQTGLLSKTDEAWINNLAPRGELLNLNMNIHGPWSEPNNYSLSGEFVGITNKAWGKIPAVSDLHGFVDWNGVEGHFKLDSKNATVDINKIFANPLLFTQLTGSLYWQKAANGSWIFKANNIQAINQDINVHADGTLTLPVNDSAHIDLTSHFSLMNAAHVSNYLPLKLYDTELVEWLRNAFLSGQLVDGTAVLQGRLSDFPFDNGSGKFMVSGLAQNIEFNYAPQWPLMHDANGKLVFSGRAMTIDLTSAKILDVPVRSVHAEIPYFGDDKPQVLSVQGNIQGDLSQGLNFIQNSPLQNTIGKNLSALQMTGPMQLALGLTIPLKNPTDTKVDGKTSISNATLHMPDWNLSLNDLTGSFNFTEDSISASNMTGQLFSEPVVLNLATEHPAKQSGYVTAKLQGTISAAALQSWLALPIEKTIQGTTHYRAELQLPSQGQSTQPTQITIYSNLQGMKVDLPEGYAKKAESTVDVKLNINVNANQPIKAKLVYDKLFSAALTLQRAQQTFNLQSGDLHLGSGEADWPSQPGIIITGNLDKIDWNEIEPYITQFSKKSDKKPLVNPDLFRGVDIKVNSVNLAGLQLNQASIQLSRQGNNFLLDLNSAEMAGQLVIPPLDSSAMIQAKFQHLYLTSQEMSSGENTINPKVIPPIAFVGENVRYGEMNLGRVILNLVPVRGGLMIKQLDLVSPVYSLHASGEWLGDAKQSRSHMRGNITTSSVTKVLADWGLSSVNLEGSKGNADFNLNWSGAPFKPSTQGLFGTIALKLGEGRIINLSNETNAKMGLGRVLNVFSLQSLPRRLSLNFSDLFEKGYVFDSMEGDFNLKNGNAITQNTRFDGPVAGIEIAGRIGLIAKDFDLKLSVTPYVTASLPVVAAIATVNPLAGVATWMVNTVLGHAVSQFIKYNYTITGPWDSPVWTQIGTQKIAKPVPNKAGKT